MKQVRICNWLMAAALAVSVTACGGGSGAANSTNVSASLAAAAALAANDASNMDNPSAPFVVVQDAGVAAVTVNSPPVINFAVFSDGKPVTGLTTSNARLAIAKLVPGANGSPDHWENYVTSSKAGKAGVGPGGSPALSTAAQASTDSGGTLVYNTDGYYTYTFKTDITNVSGITYEPSRTHRVAIQLSYINAADETVRVNPYFDFTISGGKSVQVTDSSKTRKMTDVNSCNSCHEKLALHGGGRVDTQFCVMCHNPGTTDPESGNNLNLATMVHSIHAGKKIKADSGTDYTIWGYKDSKHDYAEVGFPQDLRNCSKCHDGSNPKTPQGDNWKTVISKEACLTCHTDKAGEPWDSTHKSLAQTLIGSTAVASDLTNAQCKNCHSPGSDYSPEVVHFNQVETNSAKYKMNIESATYVAGDNVSKKGTVTVKYYLSDPTNGDAAYDLSDSRFGSVYLYVAYQNMDGKSAAATEFTSYNNGGNRVRALAKDGTKDANNHYSVDVDIPLDSASSSSRGTARVISIGQAKEKRLKLASALLPRPEDPTGDTVNVLIQNTHKDFVISGALNPRRTVVSNDKCNACHGALGATSGSNTLANAFHSGARSTVEACAMCHDANRMSSSSVMTNGLELNESYQMKRMIHGIHGNSKRTYPFTHGNPVVGVFGKDGTLPLGGYFLDDYSIRNFTPTGSGPLVAAGTPVPAGSTFQSIADLITVAASLRGYTGTVEPAENFAAEVAWPGVGIHCTACHVNNSYQNDQGPLGSVVAKPITATSPIDWLVMSPKASTCTACHDGGDLKHFPGTKVTDHVQYAGFGYMGYTATQTQDNYVKSAGETCASCHSPGQYTNGYPTGVDVAHGLK